MHTADLSPTFFDELPKVCAAVECHAAHLLCVMYAESGVRAKAENPQGHASGLIQFMPDTLPGVGWTGGHEAFRRLAAHEQLPYVQRYFAPHRGKLVSTAALYTATFLPADLQYAADQAFVLVQKGGRRGWAFDVNAGFDQNRDLAITVGELDLAIKRQCRGPRWEEIAARAGIIYPGVAAQGADPGPFDLTTTLGIQQALAKLRYDPGPIDGWPGPRTRGAVVSFQRGVGITADGICGPVTREALRKALSGTLPPAA